MLPLLKTKVDDKEFVFTKVSGFTTNTKPIEGSGSGTAENGDRIVDIRAYDVTITATIEKLTRDEYTKIMSVLRNQVLELTYWEGLYKTHTFKVDSVDSELLKSEQRPNTKESNRWNVTVTFTKIK